MIMTEKIHIKDIHVEYPEPKTIDYYINGELLRVETYLPLEKKLLLIQRVMNMCAGEGTFCNPVQVQILTQLEMVMAYSNIEIDESALQEDVYAVYDYLYLEGIIEIILCAIDAKERKYIESACWETADKLTQFNNSAAGIINRLSAEGAMNNLNVEDLIEKVKDPAIGEFLKNFADARIV